MSVYPASRVRHVYAGPYVDRLSEQRADAAWLRQALAAPSTLLVPVWRTRNLLAPAQNAAVLVPAVDAGACLAAGTTILLGEFRGRICFAVELDAREPPALPVAGEFLDLRQTLGDLPADEAGLLAYARGMVYWRGRHRYCSSCGAANEATQAGHVMRCTNAECATECFPRVDPAIIVLVSDGERALLGRQSSWPAARYSTIAGFVEPGESLEDAVAREVREETGIVVREVAYHSSQPWPFPSSLMLGFQALADGGQQPAAGEELEDARWFTRVEVAGGHPALPPPQSISFRLIEQWFDRDGARLLATPGARLWTLKS